MRQNVPAAIDRIGPRRRPASQNTAFTPNSLAEQVSDAIAALSPLNDAQRQLKPRIVQASDEIARARAS